MSFQHFLWLPLVPLVYFALLVPLKIQSTSYSEGYRVCSIPFRCGNLTAGYPFWGVDRPSYCGHPDLQIFCENDKPIMQMNNLSYLVLNVGEKAGVLRIARTDYLGGICSPRFINTTLNPVLFNYTNEYQMLTLLYACPNSPFLTEHFTCSFTGTDKKDGYIEIGSKGPEACDVGIIVPFPKSLILQAKENRSVLKQAFRDGFQVKWNVDNTICEKCIESQGFCGYDEILNMPICFCRNGHFNQSEACYISLSNQGSNESPASGVSSNGHNDKNKSFFNKPRKIAVGIIASVVGIIIILSMVGLGRLWKKKTKDDQSMEAFIRNCGSHAPQKYNFSDVRNITKSFSEKLGQGGYGNVYKGKLPDGRLVAVKILKESKGNGEEFINEVASMSRTSHVNIVSLLGFCCERNKRALIYEFMCNGSLDKFKCDRGSSTANCNLEWKTLYQIAIGIARGLEYLHRGCNIRIVHFDIKPHNILLDGEFCPKISDFGLAKQSNQKDSIMSMLNTRGTIGYIAPEMFYRTFGGVSYKSDVYSYGMMILEVVGARKNIGIRTSQTSEIYFPDSIYNLLELGNDFGLPGVVTEEEKQTAKQMILVSLWCIQTNPSDRPSMTKVVEMLEGTPENLQIPPKPYWSSPPRFPKLSLLASSSTQLASECE
ncbi:LEAF RUST 10 DISEASE-RESISTANCE LOCUS RECEPTOR-LIKE PROTEIN KINASE-like 2.4 [Mangifera indica]|uniref:LEAF RUST 10 DISEASE-RESISTANCE LOCUS RECEPTOR-LIKE PROTEIN KINASE-like 2.4 n=1 Tax=Mangifera indica TaxID=29780 RepID=UPI001CFC0F95|nr:LEAF RUST 10 DISEASE-RESISTANCE LOCUS RECEPTOR-LIKE PROTEIN KINASE-like 2.4 [Mangifera indica]